MAYLGNTPSETFHQATSQVFNGDGSTTAFTLEKRVNRAEEIEVFVNNIQQQPTVAYSANNTTLTFTEAPDSATGNIYVVYRMFAQQNTFNALHDFTDAVTMASTLAVTGNVTMAGTHTVTGVSILNGGIDVAGDFNFDIGGGDLTFKDDGTSVVNFGLELGNFIVNAPTSNTDIIFKGNDGGSAITALTLDMSASGQANFNSNIFTGNTAEFVDGTGTGDKGVQINPIGMVVATRNGGISGIFGRQASDGDILQFRKGGSAVGKIGSISDNIFLANTTTGGLKFGTSGGSTIVDPTNETGAVEDATHDLGSSGGRWRNLYLSSGLFVGGTGSANQLDDYEEGTWTPVINTGATGGSYNNTGGVYTKIGNMVTFAIRIQPTGWTGNSDGFSLSGLPFTSNGGGRQGGAFFNYLGNFEDPMPTLHIGSGATLLSFFTQSGVGLVGNTINNLNVTMHIQGFYYTA